MKRGNIYGTSLVQIIEELNKVKYQMKQKKKPSYLNEIFKKDSIRLDKIRNGVLNDHLKCKVEGCNFFYCSEESKLCGEHYLNNK